MKPTISFHDVAKISVDAVAHFERDDKPGGEFWTRTIMFTDGDGGTFAVSLFTDRSADDLDIGGVAPKVVSCSCGYVGPDKAHRPPEESSDAA